MSTMSSSARWRTEQVRPLRESHLHWRLESREMYAIRLRARRLATQRSGRDTDSPAQAERTAHHSTGDCLWRQVRWLRLPQPQPTRGSSASNSVRSQPVEKNPEIGTLQRWGRKKQMLLFGEKE